VKEIAVKHGDFPVIVAGGIYSYNDILRFLRLGADGVQMGTRFLATEESSASACYKQALLDANKEDIIVSQSLVPRAVCLSGRYDMRPCSSRPKTAAEGRDATKGTCS
jgi:NAD(P)H-dependent flavin oxidoreductase YrpB (nitropropane dioxygenase family)